MARRRARSVRWPAGLIALVAVLAACSGIPTTGPVVEGDPVRAQRPPPYVSVVPAPPSPGADELGIVLGWLSAMASYVPGYPVAREFLTPEAAAAWQPSSGVTVVDDSIGAALTTPAAGRVRAAVDVVATLGPGGGYRKADPPRDRVLDLRLEQVDGEWRIANPPDGVVLTSFDFDRDFTPRNLYFFEPGREVLVPDTVYLPVRGSQSTLLVEALLRGPSAWLAPAVVTAFPRGSALEIRSVPVDSGTATVALTAEAGAASPSQRDRMAAQLSWTLHQVPEVQRLSITAGGLALLAGRPTADTRGTYDRYDPAVLGRDAPLFALRDGVLVRARDDGDPTPVDGPLGRGEPRLEAVAVDVPATRAAGVVAGGARLVVAGFGPEDPVVDLLAGTDLAAPAFDRTGLVWVVDRRAGGSVLVVGDPASGTWAEVPLPELKGLLVGSLAVSLDGTRIALVADGRLLVGTVLRDPAEPTAVRVSGLQPVPVEDRPVLDVAWADPAELAVLAEPDGEEPQVDLTGLEGAQMAARGSVPGAVSLAAAPGQGPVVATGEGQLLRVDAVLRWNVVGEGTAPAYPG